jgi:long-chain acyl-CoA synthetase
VSEEPFDSFDDDDDELYGFWLRAQAEPDRIVLVEDDGTERSAGEVLSRVNRIVRGLRALGLERGDVVAGLLPNLGLALEMPLACMQAGWYYVPINYHLKAGEVAYIIDDSEARAFITHERFGALSESVFEDIAVPKEARFAVGDVEGYRPFEELTDGQPDDLPEGRDAGIFMTYTSGTSGRPKGVKRPLPDFDADTYGEMLSIPNQLFGLGSTEGVHLVAGALYHTAPLGVASSALHSGNVVVIMEDFDAEEVLRRTERYKVTTSHMVPTMFVRMLKLPEEARNRYDLSSLRNLVHAAAPCPIPVKRAMIDWLGPIISEYYAATEGGGTLVTSEEWLERPGTVGTAWPISKVKVGDEEGNELPRGETGLIWMKLLMGAFDKFEYHGDAAKTKLSHSDDGFFTVGDMGYMDSDGYLFIADRKIDMIISGGVNIYPAEVEAALIDHPAVLDVAVFGVPDEEWGEQVKAAVELVEEHEPSPELEAELIAHAKQTIANLKAPKTIDFTELPRDPNGKVYKRHLRDPYWEGRERKV